MSTRARWPATFPGPGTIPPPGLGHAAAPLLNARVHTHEIEVDTSRQRFVDLTAELNRFCAGRGDGLVNVFVPHATAGLALMELGPAPKPTSRPSWTGSCRGTIATGTPTARPATAPTIVLPALISPSVTIPVLGGRAALGTWQSLVLVDFNVDNPRRHVRLSFVPAPTS